MAQVSTRYFLGCDNSGHWYLVDASRRAEWDLWVDLDPEDEAGWEPPGFARRIDGGPGRITFTDPVEEA